MLALTDEQRSMLSRVVEAARRTDRLPEALDAIYAEFQTQLDRRKPKCDASGRCCRFDSYGHRLFVTTIELAIFSMRVSDPARNWDGNGCPFQVDALCSVHRDRPFGCRIFFCDPDSKEWQQSNYEQFHAKIKALHESFGIEYLYVEWREGLKALGIAPPTIDRLRVINHC